MSGLEEVWKNEENTKKKARVVCMYVSFILIKVYVPGLDLYIDYRALF